jgi:acetyltransferase
MTALIDCARIKGYRAVVGDVLSTNAKMFRLMTSLGFTIHPHPDDTAVKRVVKTADQLISFLLTPPSQA